MNRDDLDLGSVKVSRLFRKYFVPTLIGMLNIAVATTMEGVFVGHEIGNDGIAAINLVMPIMLLFTGIGLMLGIGSSVAASIHLAKNNVKAARINVTQAFLAGTVVIVVCSALMYAAPTWTSLFLGSSQTLLPLTREYLVWLMPGFLFNMWIDIGLFVIRLDGAPRMAMTSSLVSGVLSVLLGWLFICVLGWGLIGAALATVAALLAGAAIVVMYVCFMARTLTPYKLKRSRKSLMLTLRNLGYQCRIGSSAFLGEATIVVLMFVGNHVFMRYLGDDGVGAFGIACYYMPFVFMMGNAIAQSAQPIISYNYGAGNDGRVNDAFAIAMKTAAVCGAVSAAAFMLMPRALVALFVDTSGAAAQMAVEGFPYMSTGFLFYVLNLAVIGYYQSVEKLRPATTFAVLRGFAILVPAFMAMPVVWGTKGIWLALPASEIITFLIVTVYVVRERRAGIAR